MKKITNLQAVLCGALLFFSAADVVGQVKVQKQEFFKYPFRGWVTDISKCRLGTNDLILILGQAHGVLINEQKVVQKEFFFRTCTDPVATQVGEGQCIVFCRGGGFSPIFAVDLTGKEMWTNSARFIANVVRHPAGRFYVCTMFDGVKILDSNGSLIETVSGAFRDLVFLNSTTALTMSETTKKGNRLQFDIRNEKLEVLKSFPIESGASRIIAYNWPKTNDVCYRTARQLICANGDGKTVGRFNTGQTVGATGAIVKDDQGDEYLALLAFHKSAEASSTLFILNKDFKKVHEETLPTSRAVTTLGTTNRLFVSYGNAGAFEYRLNRQR